MGKKKDINSCKHPNSRKTIALSKQLKKASNRQKTKFGNVMKQNLLAEKLLWFKDRLDENIQIYAPKDVEALINLYLARFEDELEQIRLKHSIGARKNRQHANREDIINLTVKREEEEFNTAGLEIPDLMNPKHLDVLKKWNGELRFLQNITCKRISKTFLQAELERVVKANQIKAADGCEGEGKCMDVD